MGDLRDAKLVDEFGRRVDVDRGKGTRFLRPLLQVVQDRGQGLTWLAPACREFQHNMPVERQCIGQVIRVSDEVHR